MLLWAGTNQHRHGLSPRSSHGPVPGSVFKFSRLVFLLAIIVGCAFGTTHGAELEQVESLFLNGRYEDAAKLARAELKERVRNEDWPILLSKCLLATGQYAEAQAVIATALARNPWGIRVRLAAREVLMQNGQVDQARELVQEINNLAATRTYAYRDSASLVALGKAALLLDADARRVLDNFFNRVKKADPTFRETYLAIGQLALDKYDSELAGKTFQEGLERFENDPELLYGLAKSYSTGDRSEMLPLLEKVLTRNERHVPTLLLLADHLIDAEEYKKADEMLDKALGVNAGEPEAWAYRAVLAHLRNQPQEEEKARGTALSRWKNNPKVDHLIGLKLSQKYRFSEGSAYQRRALKSDEEYLPAKRQLAQDLLRLGEDEEGWALAEDISKTDGYDVLAYNLVTLHDTVSTFRVLTNADFKVRMHPHEAAVYGQRVTDLLDRAKRALCRKYGLEIQKPTVVEIFPEQKDFAVRTFGMPGGEGFLGVCFGNVITANSPASSTANLINWQAVLWHEFCHVVTLGLTKNKMPRWLSEGISVYEERQANQAWGEQLSPRYREMILKGELTPVGNLSAAFLAPKTPFHLQFAYYQSGLVVEFLIEHFGLEALKKILRDLGDGKSINRAIEDHTTSLSRIEKQFAEYARERAEQLGAGLDWAEPNPEDLRDGPDRWMTKHPKSIWTLTHQAKKLLAEEKWAEAKVPLQKLLELYPENTGPDNAYLLLAEAHRGLSETEQERAVLNKLARIDADALESYVRLMELETGAQDWNGATRNALRFLAVNPLVAPPYRFLARASEELGRDSDAVQAYETLLLLEPPDPADLHYRLARLLHKTGDTGAKRQVLQALEEAPRFRDAHRLLLKISREKQPAELEASSAEPPISPTAINNQKEP